MCNHDINCFRCLGSGYIPLEDCSDVEIAYPVEREALVMCVLNVQVKEDDVDQLREHLSH